MKLAIIINECRAAEILDQLPELAKKYNINYDLFIIKPDQLETVLKELNHQSYSGFIVGGGDGTVRTAAEQLMHTELPLAILPLGTFNLLAKSLQHINDLDALFAMIKNGKTKKIDLVEINNKIMINHAWIGFYYYILKLREQNKEIFSKNRLLKMLFNIFNLFNIIPIYELDLLTDEKHACYKTCLLFVSNNESHLNLFNFGEHKSLTTGLLNVTILNCHSRWGLLKCLLNSLIMNPKDNKYMSNFSATKLIVREKKTINIVIDGELFKLSSPIEFTILPKQLTVFTP